MTLQELATLRYFRPDERYLNGQPIDWASISYRTLYWLDVLRAELGAPIRLIRGAHPHQPTAVDACCPARSLAEVYLALTRLPDCSWGIYSGASFHVDTREYETLPARWLAVRETEVPLLRECGLAELETGRRDGWVYLSYRHPRSLEAIGLICRLAAGETVRHPTG